MDGSLPKIIGELLEKMHLTDREQVQRFLDPKLAHLPNPLGMKGMESAVELIRETMEKGGDIVIWGDYDVDGTTGTALLIHFFRALGIEVHWHIPNRLKEGYGLNAGVFRSVFASLTDTDFLLITVDCGISDAHHVRDILTLGGQVIVTDHHQLPVGELPGCIILNPNQEQCGLGEEKLAGVGVAFYLAVALRTALEKQGYFATIPKPIMKDYLGFVALGTIADLVELTPTNRVLVRAGMEALKNSGIVGLQELLKIGGVTGGPLTTEDIGFSLGPLVNAAGRLGVAEAAVALMTCDNSLTGVKLSRQLERYNNERKRICTDNLESALTLLDDREIAEAPAILVAGDFHSGVIGIVAARIVEIYNRPAIVFSREYDEKGAFVLKGSGRSVGGIHLLECLHACESMMLRYGGHAMAAGLTVESECFDDFRTSFIRQVGLARQYGLHAPIQEPYRLECRVDDVMNEEALKYLLKLEPFGPENEKPIFVDNAAQIIQCRQIGANRQHLQLTVRGQYANHRGVGFGLGDRYADIRKNPQRQISFTPMLNRFRGNIDWQLRILAI